MAGTARIREVIEGNGTAAPRGVCCRRAVTIDGEAGLPVECSIQEVDRRLPDHHWHHAVTGVNTRSAVHPRLIRLYNVDGENPLVRAHSLTVAVTSPMVRCTFVRWFWACSRGVAQRQLLGS
jgi:hypothetical protein